MAYHLRSLILQTLIAIFIPYTSHTSVPEYTRYEALAELDYEARELQSLFALSAQNTPRTTFEDRWTFITSHARVFSLAGMIVSLHTYVESRKKGHTSQLSYYGILGSTVATGILYVWNYLESCRATRYREQLTESLSKLQSWYRTQRCAENPQVSITSQTRTDAIAYCAHSLLSVRLMPNSRTAQNALDAIKTCITD